MLLTMRLVGAPGTAEDNTRFGSVGCFSRDTTLTLTLTSFRCLKLQRGAGWPLPLAVVDPDVEQVEAEGVEARQQAAGAIPTEVQDVLLRVVAVVSVQAALSPVIHLRHGGSVSMKGDDNLWI